MTNRLNVWTCIFCFAAGTATASAPAAEPAGPRADPAEERLENSPRHHEWTAVKTESGRSVKCLVVYPEVDAPATTVVLIHENQGLNAWARSAADQVAEAGFLCVAPDLLSQTGPDGGGTAAYTSADAARTGIYALPPAQVLNDLDAVVTFARGLPASNKKVAVAGFCWGGGQAFRCAAHHPNIAAAMVFYGSAPEDEVLQKIKVPVYGFYGGNDFRITGQVPEVQQKMQDAGKTFQPVTYEGAGHGFMRSGEGPTASEANRQARQQAWQRLKELLSTL